MLKEILEMIIPVYGDMKIHRLFAKDRVNSKRELKNIQSNDKQLGEREIKFKQELSDLLNKYDIKEEMGSLVSYPSQYVANERSNLGELVIRSTIVPEIVMYVGKYTVLLSTFYQFSP